MEHSEKVALIEAAQFWREVAQARQKEIDRLTAKVLELQRKLGKLENPKQ
jgi:polyhydroxyalkanoate synthesis regulator phasin